MLSSMNMPDGVQVPRSSLLWGYLVILYQKSHDIMLQSIVSLLCGRMGEHEADMYLVVYFIKLYFQSL